MAKRSLNSARLFLLADSAPLFDDDFVARLGNCSEMPGVYIGASNGDRPEYFEIAEAFFQLLGASPSVHLRAETESYLADPDRASVIILAGGDVGRGWRYLNKPVIRDWLETQRKAGSVFLGISAGAIHLGQGLNEQGRLRPYLNWLKDGIAAHEEASGWPSRAAMLNQGCRRVWCVPHGDAVAVSQYGSESFKGTVMISTASTDQSVGSWRKKNRTASAHKKSGGHGD